MKRSRIRPRRAKPRPGRTRDPNEWERIKAAVRDRQKDRCALCNEACNRGNYHHILPRSRGGPDRESNILLLHPTCHDFVHGHPTWARTVGLLR